MKTCNANYLGSLNQENLMFRVNLDNLVKPCLKTKMLLKKLRKADRLELRSGVKDSKWKGGVEKEN